MSVSIMTVNGEPNSTGTKEFICSSVEDIAKLPRYGIGGIIEGATDITVNYPCAIGSMALVCGDNGVSSVYILNPLNKWVEL